MYGQDRIQYVCQEINPHRSNCARPAYIISTSTDLFELVVHTSEPASVTGTRKIAYINDIILAGHGVSADWFSVWPEWHQRYAWFYVILATGAVSMHCLWNTMLSQCTYFESLSLPSFALSDNTRPVGKLQSVHHVHVLTYIPCEIQELDIRPVIGHLWFLRL